MRKAKGAFLDFLGGFGIILYYGLTILISILPFVFIDLNFILTALLVGVQLFFPISSIIFWVWGLVKAICGTQDVWSVIYYIATVILFLPSFIHTVIGIFSKD